jgi:enediyne biosynthesis protein E4
MPASERFGFTLIAVLFLSSFAFAQVPATELVAGNFVEVTAAAGVQFLHQAPHTSRKYLIETMGSGAALFDYDNDGLLDIFLVNGAPFTDPTPKGTIPQKTGPKDWNRLYRQKANGTFEDVTEKAGLQGVGYGMGVAAGDYDNDGREDLYVTAYGGNKLYHNNGDGTFADVTQKAGVGGSGWSTSAAWVDLDGDGFLDLVVLRYIQWDWDDRWCGEHREGYRSFCHPDVFSPIPMLVYHNNGNGTFTEEAQKRGLDTPAKALGIAIGDFDNDGHPDIFVANDSMVEFLFHNKGNGTFEEGGLQAGIAVDSEGRTFAGMGMDVADYNNDGLLDLIIDDLANQKYALYQNAGDGSFTYATYAAGVGRMTQLHSGWGLRFLDYDNDGWKDVLIAQGHDLDTIETISPQLHYREPMLLARNIEGKKFVDVSSISGEVFSKRWVGRGMATGDIDNDGLMDAVVTENGGPVHILMNHTKTGNHWLGLSLTGHKSNRDAIGALVKVTTSSGSRWATVTTCSSYLSSSDKRLHFGLGTAATAQSVEIRWPSGIVQTLREVKGDQYLKIDEPVQKP